MGRRRCHTPSSDSPVMTSRDSRLAAAAASNHAVVDDRAAEEAGLSPTQIRYRARTGALERVHENVWTVAGAPTTLEQRLLAAVLAAGPDAAASHRAGAWV